VLYLLEPSLSVLCNRDSGSTRTLDRARANPQVDLARLRWEAVPEPANREHLLTLALICGTPCSRGIVLDGALVGILDRGRPHTRDYRRSEPMPARTPAHQQAVDAWLGTPPRVVLERQGLADRNAAQHAVDQQKATAQAARLLAEPLSQALLRHWISLGGPKPA
jgi:hypothetical protein